MEKMSYKEKFFDKLDNLKEDYFKVKHAIILLENFDDERKMYIAPINQLRSALDHLFKAVVEASADDKCDYELKEAKEHMDRAGYDALELLAGELGSKVIDKVSRYNTNTLAVVFPEYYKIIKPQLTSIRNDVTVLRSNRKIENEKSFSAYFDKFEELIEMDKKIDLMIPSLEEYQSKQNKEGHTQSLKQIIIGIIIAIVAFFLGKYFK